MSLAFLGLGPRSGASEPAAPRLRECMLEEAAQASVKASAKSAGFLEDFRRRYQLKLSPERHESLALAYAQSVRNGKATPEGQRALEQLLQDFEPFFRALAFRFQEMNRFASREDLYAEMRVHVAQALAKYSPAPGSTVVQFVNRYGQYGVRLAVLNELRSSYGFGTNRFELRFYWNRSKVFKDLPDGPLTLQEATDRFNQWLVDDWIENHPSTEPPQDRESILASLPERATPSKMREALLKLGNVPGLWLPEVDVPAKAASDAESTDSGEPLAPSLFDSVADRFEIKDLEARIKEIEPTLTENEREVLNQRIRSPHPLSTRELAARLRNSRTGRAGVSRQTVEQTELRLKEKLAAGRDLPLAPPGKPVIPPRSPKSFAEVNAPRLREWLRIPGYRERLVEFAQRLHPNDRLILEHRLLADEPLPMSALLPRLATRQGGEQARPITRQAANIAEARLIRRIEQRSAIWLKTLAPEAAPASLAAPAGKPASLLAEIRALADDPAFRAELEAFASHLDENNRLLIQHRILAKHPLKQKEMGARLSTPRSPKGLSHGGVQKLEGKLLEEIRKHLPRWFAPAAP